MHNYFKGRFQKNCQAKKLEKSLKILVFESKIIINNHELE